MAYIYMSGVELSGVEMSGVEMSNAQGHMFPYYGLAVLSESL